jgi:hypothetical protein
MKKYRCLWCMSILNHNSWYFGNIRGIRLLNTALRLWKCAKALVWRGVSRLDHAKIRLDCAFQREGCTFLSLILPATPHKAQKQCRFSDFPVQMWTLGADFSSFASANKPHSAPARYHPPDGNRPRMHRTRSRSFVPSSPCSLSFCSLLLLSGVNPHTVERLVYEEH